jgi:hypothetical protein
MFRVFAVWQADHVFLIVRSMVNAACDFDEGAGTSIVTFRTNLHNRLVKASASFRAYDGLKSDCAAHKRTAGAAARGVFAVLFSLMSQAPKLKIDSTVFARVLCRCWNGISEGLHGAPDPEANERLRSERPRSWQEAQPGEERIQQGMRQPIFTTGDHK